MTTLASNGFLKFKTLLIWKGKIINRGKNIYFPEVKHSVTKSIILNVYLGSPKNYLLNIKTQMKQNKTGQLTGRDKVSRWNASKTICSATWCQAPMEFLGREGQQLNHIRWTIILTHSVWGETQTEYQSQMMGRKAGDVFWDLYPTIAVLCHQLYVNLNSNANWSAYV